MSEEYSRLHNKHETEFSKYFFSDTNIKALSVNLQFLLAKAGYKTKPQCDYNILSYMMNIYEIYANPLNSDYEKEKNKLNDMILDKMYYVMITEIKQYLGYIKDASVLPDPIDHPTHMTSKKSIEYDSFA
tara:strand:+ start:360 stop:749 length:390 start_codon:yes stop_codon:yes gene_type:complete